jgi:RimJ/RimL family protein N-acetyltransferase
VITLLPATADHYRALAEGRPVAAGLVTATGGVEPPETIEMLIGWANRLTKAQGWGCWLMLRDGVVVGSCAVKDMPDAAGGVEIGYGVAPVARGQGVATGAVAAMLAVLAGHGVRLVRAETAVTNLPSGRVLQKSGFAQTGERDDAEDGPCIQWERRLG